MRFFRPALNQHGLTEQQWRVIRILSQHGELEVFRLADLACILKPSMTGVLARMQTQGLVQRRRSLEDQRRVLVRLAPGGEQVFGAMVEGMESNYGRIQAQLGEEKLHTLLGLLEELKRVQA